MYGPPWPLVLQAQVHADPGMSLRPAFGGPPRRHLLRTLNPPRSVPGLHCERHSFTIPHAEIPIQAGSMPREHECAQVQPAVRGSGLPESSMAGV